MVGRIGRRFLQQPLGQENTYHLSKTKKFINNLHPYSELVKTFLNRPRGFVFVFVVVVVVLPSKCVGSDKVVIMTISGVMFPILLWKHFKSVLCILVILVSETHQHSSTT